MVTLAEYADIMDFAKRLELPKTTIAGLVATLEAVGYLEKEPTSGKYRLGPELFQLGVNYAANIDVVTIGRPLDRTAEFPVHGAGQCRHDNGRPYHGYYAQAA
jgi:DNA-binding IclR family transcriptional regulator